MTPTPILATPELIQAALRRVEDAVLDAVHAGGTLGAPSGIMYAALAAQGCSLNQYQTLMQRMVNAELVRRDGDLYHLLPKGEERRKAAAVA